MICLAMFMVLGGHWAVFQAVAWSQMAISYSKDEGSVSGGLAKTFSGKFPCSMCKSIAKNQQDQQPAPLVKADKKLEGFLLVSSRALHPPFSGIESYPRLDAMAFPSRAESPDAPVPIVA